MKNLVILFLLVFSYGCAQDKQPIKAETEWQKKMNADYKDATKSPLKVKTVKNLRA